MNTLRRLWNARHDDRGSQEVFAFMLTLPILLGIIVVVWMSMTFRESIRLPVDLVVSSYTGAYGSYGTNEPPEYASFAADGQADTITGRMTDALDAIDYVKTVNEVQCGLIIADGRIDPTATIYANSPVGCSADVTLYGWPFATALPVADVLFGGEYRAASFAYTDRGANPNVQ